MTIFEVLTKPEIKLTQAEEREVKKVAKRLPSTSKRRKAGKEDIVQTFDPAKHYGANQPRFLNYVNLCLANKFRTIR